MPPRVAALLLALVLMWSGVAMAEQRIAFASDAPTPSQSAEQPASQPAGFVGSLGEHQVDDQPSQPHAEHVLDFVLLLDAVPGRRAGVLIAARPWPPADAMRLPPCLEGLQRPPCGTPSRFSPA
ncbi:MAG: hypothetical protein EOP81_12335 [Variovorax sp.]|nr:MAG: hypothetical protein EOP81_12335 [Variovorax sp.]